MAGRTFRRVPIVAGVLALLAAGAVFYLATADLGWSRDLVARAASRALGRELVIGGEYHLRLGRTVHLEASGITVANAPWAPEGPLATIGHLEVAVAAGSLLRGPLHVTTLRIGHADIHLLRTAQGLANWEPAGKPRPARHRRRARLPRVDHLRMDGLHVRYDAPGRPRPLDLHLAGVRVDSGASGMLELDLHGTADGTPLRLAGRLGPLGRLARGQPFQQDLEFQLGTLEGTLEGRTASLSTFRGARLTLTVHGPSSRELASLLGLPLTKNGPFRLEVYTRPDGQAIAADLDLHAPVLRVTGTTRILSLSPPSFDADLDASGTDLALLAAAAGVHGLPRTHFELRTKLRFDGFPIRLRDFHLDTGLGTLSASGTVGAPPALDGTAISATLRAANAEAVGRLASLPLPRGPLHLTGRIRITGAAIGIEDLAATIGRNSLRASGVLTRTPGHRGSSLTINAGGPDLAAFDRLAGTGLPAGPFHVDGGLSMTPRGLDLEKLHVEIGGTHVTASGTVTSPASHTGTELELAVRGPDPAPLASLAGLHGLPAGPFHGNARLHVGARSLEIRGIDLVVGRTSATGEIHLARPPTAGPIELDLHVEGADLSDLGPLLGLEGLPARPFTASGRLQITAKDYGFSKVQLDAGDLHARASGRLGRPPSFDGTRLTVHATGHDLAELGPVLTLPDLPALAFELDGGLEISPQAISLRKIHGTLGTSRIAVDGAFRPRGHPLHLALNVRAEGKDPSGLGRFLEGIGAGRMPSLPRRPYAVTGHLAVGAEGLDFTGFEMTLGALQAAVNGHLGTAPQYRGTRLEVTASGGNGVNIEELTGYRPEVDGLRFHCTVHRLQRASRSGSLLRIEGSLRARRLRLLTKPAPPAGQAAAEGSSNGKREAQRSPFVFPDTPIHFRLPEVLEGKIDCQVAQLLLGEVSLSDVHVGLALDPGGLRLDPLEATPGTEGRLTGTVLLAPRPAPLRVVVDLRAVGVDPESLEGDAPRRDTPRLDARIELHARGGSLHALAAGASGRFSFHLTQGTVVSSILDSLGDSFILQVLDAFNPFRKKEGTTHLECATVAGTISGGKVTLKPMGIKTSKVTTVARGTVDLATEKFSIDFTSKARRGLGFSASTLTNQFIKIGGTLRKPSVQFKPLSAAAKTGLAVVTAGLSLVASGLWNRVTAESNICDEMESEIDAMWKTPAPETVPQKE